jgi:hypothetical protein
MSKLISQKQLSLLLFPDIFSSESLHGAKQKNVLLRELINI